MERASILAAESEPRSDLNVRASWNLTCTNFGASAHDFSGKENPLFKFQLSSSQTFPQEHDKGTLTEQGTVDEILSLCPTKGTKLPPGQCKCQQVSVLSDSIL